MIREKDRIDLLMTRILGYECRPHHFQMLKHRMKNRRKSMLLAFRGCGKALSLDTPMPTPSGWTTMGDVKVGDALFDEHGRPCSVVDVFDVQHGRTCYEVEFSDGTKVVADRDHLWLTETKKARYCAKGVVKEDGGFYEGPLVRTTEDIRETLIYNASGSRPETNHSVPVAGPLQTHSIDLPIPPYTLGAWLGDGASSSGHITSADEEIVSEIRREGLKVAKLKSAKGKASLYRIETARGMGRHFGPAGDLKGITFRGRLKLLGVLENKSIPPAYLRASIGQRRSLLAGLMDTDGHAGHNGRVEFCSVNLHLAEGVFELASSLGFKPVLTEGEARIDGRYISPKYRVTWTPHEQVFRLRRKAERVGEPKSQASRNRRRFIVAVREVPSVPVRCVTVDSPSHLFLCSRAMIPTHNSYALTVAYAIFLLVKDPNKRILIASRSGKNAERIAGFIRLHFESNSTFRRVFGDYVGDRWDQRMFWIKPRASLKSEASVATVGIEGAVVSQHYDVILCDDLVDNENARSTGMRQQTESFFYQSLLPCLEPDGEIHIVGTRYHHRDLYGVLMEPDMRMHDVTCIIPALSRKEGVPDDAPEVEKWISAWPEKFDVEMLLQLKKESLLSFETQYQCSTALMVGEMFSYADMDLRPLREFPDHLSRFMGLDLAIALDRPKDYYAQVVVDYDRKSDTVWVRAVRRFRGRPTHVQRQMFYEWYDHYDCQRAVNESNFYQAAFTQDCKHERPDISVFDAQSRVDKVTRAWAIVDRIAAKTIVFNEALTTLFDEMVQFPTGEHDDQVDALGAAIQAAQRKARKPRIELGLDWTTRLDKDNVSA